MENQFKYIEGYACTTCGKVYQHIPTVCGCGQFSYLGNFKPVYEVPTDENYWECVTINKFDYPNISIKNAKKGTYREEYGDPDYKRIWVSPEFDGEIIGWNRSEEKKLIHS